MYDSEKVRTLVLMLKISPINLDEIQFAATLLVVEAHARFILHKLKNCTWKI